ncbi:MAG: N-acetylglucosamine-6-phosphate deacetylase [Firmicutes bacterium]|nr:N-acetylglucosamine-6-phosphate deacetylase [Bacillota bacterium]
MRIKIQNGTLIADRMITGQNLYLENGRIAAITPEDLPYDRLMDAQGQYVSPGFIDIHSHGGGGADFMDGGVEPIEQAAMMHLEHGTTTIYPTTLASSYPVLKQAVLDIGQAMHSSKRLPHIPGAHLEGPYFSLNQSGAQNPKYITDPIPQEYNELLELGKDIIKRWDFAPERSGSVEFCRELVKNGVIPGIAHSDAQYSEVKQIYENGCQLVTHLYSGMSTIVRKGGFRILGVVESAYLLDDMKVEMIADGLHLPPELLQLIYKCKGPQKICLVTDSMRGAGMPEGPSMLGRKEEAMPCIIEGGIAKLLDRTSFAGSVATADRLVRTCYQQARIPLVDCVRMMTRTPAEVMGLDHTGRLEVGCDADIVIFDEDIRIKEVILSGDSI